MNITFDENGLAKEAGEIKCFYFDPLSGEYVGWSDEYINIGVSIPGNSTEIDPGDEVEGYVKVFNGSEWESKEDHRGEVVYLKNDGTPYTVNYIGLLHSDVTPVQPSTPYDEWIGEKWVTNEESKKNDEISNVNKQRESLIDDANAYMNNKQWPGKAAIGRLKGDELSEYEMWLDYLDDLNEVDASNGPNIDWPSKPKTA